LDCRPDTAVDLCVERYEAFLKLQAADRGKLEDPLKGFLQDEQVAPAIASLGAFDSQWDVYVDSLAGYGLSEASVSEDLAMETP
jgi:hypothetical protein